MNDEEPTWAWTDVPQDIDAFVAALAVDAAARDEIANHPQRSVAWKRARCGRLTASNFGAAAGHHLPGADKKLLHAMLWPELFALEGRAAEFAAWGTENEPVARDVYAQHRPQCVVTETGLLVSLEQGWLASSPDFVVDEPITDPSPAAANAYHLCDPYLITKDTPPQVLIDVSRGFVRGCGEIKCPATRSLYSAMAKHAKHGLPEYYYDQIQGVMAVSHWPWCDVVVYTPELTEVTRFYYNDHYWANELLPALREFYFERFLPRLQLRAAGVLQPGEVDPVAQPLTVCPPGMEFLLTPAGPKGPKKSQKRPSSRRHHQHEFNDNDGVDAVTIISDAWSRASTNRHTEKSVL